MGLSDEKPEMTEDLTERPEDTHLSQVATTTEQGVFRALVAFALLTRPSRHEDFPHALALS